MPATALWLSDEKKNLRLMFVTQQFDDNLLGLNIYRCTEDFVPVGNPTKSEMIMDEAQYHINLRKESEEKGHLVSAHCTNPEWTPGYVVPEDQPGGHYGC